MTIDKIHELFHILADKEQMQFFSHEEIDVFLGAGSTSSFNKYRPLYQTSAYAAEALAPFKKQLDYTTDSGGLYAVNSSHKYAHLLSLDVVKVIDGQNMRVPVKIAKEDETASPANSQIRPVSRYPFAEEYIDNSTGTPAVTFKFTPAAVHAGTIRFLTQPPVPKFAYTTSGRTVTYNSGGSTQMGWTGIYLYEVIINALKLSGIPVRDEFLIEVGLKLPQQPV